MKVLLFLIPVFAATLAHSTYRTAVAIPPTRIIQSSRHARIIGGAMARQHQFPWQASILACQDGLCMICGGSLITDKHVLTAAHCTEDQPQFDIGLGSTSLYMPAIRFSTRQRFQHENYNPVTLNNDISVIVAPYSIPESASIKTIKLAPKNLGTLENKEAVVSGYGKTADDEPSSSYLKYSRMRIISNSRCSESYSGSIIKPTTICAIGLSNIMHSTCQGDSGGPLVYMDGTTYVQVGVVSFGPPDGCETGTATGYARVNAYLDWLSSKTGGKV